MSCELCQLVAGIDGASLTPIWHNSQLVVVLVDEPAYPGFCRVIWRAHVKEMSDLAPAERSAMMDVVWQVELAMRDVMAPDKVNLASLGNMTPHLHWHLIPRYRDDAHFPSPLWAAAVRSTEPDVLDARRALLPTLSAAIAARLHSISQ